MQATEDTIQQEKHVWEEESHAWTWPQIVRYCFVTLGSRGVCLAAIYGLAESHPKVEGKKHWRERIRAVVEAGPYVRVAHGCWTIAELYTPEERAYFERLRRERWPLLGPRQKKS